MRFILAFFVIMGVIATIAIVVIFSMIIAQSAVSTPLFNSLEYRTNSLDLLPNWRQTLSKIEQEQKAFENCPECSSKTIQIWRSVIAEQRDSARLEQLEIANSFINQWRYRNDLGNYGRDDYWASPNEFFYAIRRL